MCPVSGLADARIAGEDYLGCGVGISISRIMERLRARDVFVGVNLGIYISCTRGSCSGGVREFEG